jgi:hypothetical protein
LDVAFTNAVKALLIPSAPFTEPEVPVYNFRATTAISNLCFDHLPPSTTYHQKITLIYIKCNMYFILTLINFLLASLPFITAQKPGWLGLCLGCTKGRTQAQSTPKDADDFTADMQAITNATGGAIDLVRTYAARGSPSTALRAADATGF